MRAQKNRTVQHLDQQSEERREEILKKAVTLGQKQRRGRRMKQKDLTEEIMRREAEKQQKQDTTERNKLEKRMQNVDIDKLDEEFGEEIEAEQMEDLTDLLHGEAVGRRVSQV